MSTALHKPLPGKLLFIVITAIVLAVLGVFTGISMIATLAFNEQIMNLSAEQQPPKFKEALEKFQRAGKQSQQLALPLYAVKTILSGLFLWSSILVIKRRERGRVDLRRWFTAALFVEFIGLGLMIYSQYQMIEPTREYYEAVLPQMAKAAVPMMVAGLVFVVGWTALKVIYYVIGRRALANPAYREYFSDSSSVA